MGRAIDADDLMKAMYHRAFEADVDTMWQSGCWMRYKAIEQVVKGQPTIEPERKKGKWIRVYSRPNVLRYLGWTCSECGYRSGEEYTSYWYKFCPGCGAKMERAEQE